MPVVLHILFAWAQWVLFLVVVLRAMSWACSDAGAPAQYLNAVSWVRRSGPPRSSPRSRLATRSRRLSWHRPRAPHPRASSSKRARKMRPSASAGLIPPSPTTTDRTVGTAMCTATVRAATRAWGCTAIAAAGISKTFDLMAAHTAVRVSMRIWMVDVERRAHLHRGRRHDRVGLRRSPTSRFVLPHDWTAWASNSADQPWIATAAISTISLIRGVHHFLDVELVVAHTQAITIGVTSDTNQDDNESFGVSEVKSSTSTKGNLRPTPSPPTPNGELSKRPCQA